MDSLAAMAIKHFSQLTALVNTNKCLAGSLSHSYIVLCLFICSCIISSPFGFKDLLNPVCGCLYMCITRAEGVMRTMNTEKLIKTLPIIQTQLDALLDFQVNMLLVLVSVIETSGSNLLSITPPAKLQRADQRGDQYSFHVAL